MWRFYCKSSRPQQLVCWNHIEAFGEFLSWITRICSHLLTITQLRKFISDSFTWSISWKTSKLSLFNCSLGGIFSDVENDHLGTVKQGKTGCWIKGSFWAVFNLLREKIFLLKDLIILNIVSCKGYVNFYCKTVMARFYRDYFFNRKRYLCKLICKRKIRRELKNHFNWIKSILNFCHLSLKWARKRLIPFQ